MFNGNYNGPYNPMAPMQQRLQQYEQNYGQPGNGSYGAAPQNYIRCQAVTSIEEARAAMINFDGSVHVFTDLANNRIYTKQINLDGAAVLNVYELKTQGPDAKTALEKRVEELELMVINLKEAINDKSNANDANGRSTKKQSKSDGANGTDV